MPDWAMPSLVSGFLTFVVTLLVVLVRNRRSLLTYHESHDRIGISTYDSIHGEISMTVGGIQAQNLYLSNVWFVNRSMRDTEDLEVKVWTGAGDMRLISEQSYVEGTIESLKHTAEFEKIKEQLSKAARSAEEAKVAGDLVRANQIQLDQASNWRTLAT